jgi:hypothetical protein
MGFRFQRRIKLLPGISLNFSKSGVSTSIGPQGAKVTLGHGKIRETVGVPGTGISYTTTTPTHALIDHETQRVEPRSDATEPESGWVTAGRIAWKAIYWLTIGVFIAAGVLLVALLAIVLSGGSSKRKRY